MYDSMMSAVKDAGMRKTVQREEKSKTVSDTKILRSQDHRDQEPALLTYRCLTEFKDQAH